MKRPLTPAVLALAAGALTPFAHAQVPLPSFTRWTVPDFDQRRSGLANDGSNHCVPTAHCNMLAYLGSHGWPLAFPDVSNAWSSGEYADITDNIHDLGVLMSTSGTNGTTGSNKIAGFNQWLVNTATYLLVNVNYQSGPDVTPWDMYFSMTGGGLVCFSYGRWSYSPADGEYQRHGGHCVTLRGVADLQFPYQTGPQLPLLKYRDPASDEGNVPGRLTGQSPFTTSELRIEPFTQDFEGYGHVTFWRLITPNVSDEYRRIIDGFTSITPMFYMENNNTAGSIILKAPFHVIDSQDQATLNISGLIDCAFGKTPAHVFALANNALTANSRLVLANPFMDQITHTVTVPGQNGRIAPGRNGEAFVVSSGLLTRYKPNPNDSGMTQLGTPASFTGAFSNLCYDDLRDGPTIFMGDGSVREYDKSLGAVVVKSLATAPGWPPTAGPQHRRIVPAGVGVDGAEYWFGPLTGNQLKRYAPAPGIPTRLVLVETVTPPAGETLSDFSLTDRGTLLLKRGGALQELMRNTAGQWVIDTTSPFNGLPAGGGGMMRISRSRNNYDPAIHGLPGWNTDIINPEPLTTESFDCAADLGRTGGVHEPDGLLDNNDFVVFIDDFFALDPRADIGSTGGLAGPDGAHDNNDFVVFIDRFFQGC